jgi:hypothetical protein
MGFTKDSLSNFLAVLVLYEEPDLIPEVRLELLTEFYVCYACTALR